jgi:uncharacterized lipoprotein YddW (UPF0748 family)
MFASIPIALLIAVGIGIGTFSQPSMIPSKQIQAIWVQDDQASTPAKADQMLDEVARSGFDTIFYLVGGGTVVYMSSLLPRNSDIPADYDPLAYVVQQAHAKGIKVQAWWAVGYTEASSKFRSLHPDWDIAKVSGIPSDEHWLNFSKPEVRRFVGDVVVEIAQNYKVDGIHLDYIRYPAPPPNGKINAADFFSPNDVPDTVKEAYQRLKAVKPQVELSAAVLAGQAASANHLQNWAKWLDGAYIDFVVPMAYYGPDETAKLAGRIAEWKSLSRADLIVPGLSISHSNGNGKTTPKTSDQLVEQIQLVRDAGFRGVAIFDSDTITGDIMSRLSSFR